MADKYAATREAYRKRWRARQKELRHPLLQRRVDLAQWEAWRLEREAKIDAMIEADVPRRAGQAGQGAPSPEGGVTPPGPETPKNSADSAPAGVERPDPYSRPWEV